VLPRVAGLPYSGRMSAMPDPLEAGETHPQRPEPSPLSQALLLGVMALLIAGAIAVLRPFLGAILWATIISVATWPALLALERAAGGHRLLAASVLGAALLLLVLAPLALLLLTLVARYAELRELVLHLANGPWPGPPDWIAHLPFGAELSARWQHAVEGSSPALPVLMRHLTERSGGWIAARLGSLGAILLDFALTLVLVIVFFLRGERLATLVRACAWRLAGARGLEGVQIAASAMRAIATGVVLTALLQSLLAGLGLWVAGVPAAAVLTSVAFMLCIAQVGPLPVLVPAGLWLFWRGDPVWGGVLLAWAGLLSTGDGFLRAWLIGRGTDMPLLLVFAGVVGGLLAFGLAGIFVGPVLLAVLARLVDTWITEEEDEDGPAAG
jgi:predicted PurR-regulated permease PerM